MKLPIKLDPPALELILVLDEGPGARLEARIDVTWAGELYLPAGALSHLRRHPESARGTWRELDPEWLDGPALGLRPAWRGTIRLPAPTPFVPVEGKADPLRRELRVHEGRPGDASSACVGRGFLARCGLVFMLDPERAEGMLLLRDG